MAHPKLVEGVDYYTENGCWVFTASYLRNRGYCCGSGCRHCPYELCETQPTAAGIRAVIQQYLHAYNQCDVTGMLALMTEDIHFEHWSDDTLTNSARGKAEFVVLANTCNGLFTEREQRLLKLQLTPVIRARISFRGVWAVERPDGPKQGTAWEVVGESEFTLSGQLIQRLVERM